MARRARGCSPRSAGRSPPPAAAGPCAARPCPAPPPGPLPAAYGRTPCRWQLRRAVSCARCRALNGAVCQAALAVRPADAHPACMAFVYDIPVLHLVNRFWIGGAERQFVERLRLHPEGFSAVVACLEPSGPNLEQVRGLGYEKLVSRLADLVVANADAVRDVCIRDEGCNPERVAVVRNGLDLKHFDAMAAAGLREPLPEGPLVAVIGNLWPVKGHRTLIDAVA